MLNHPIPFVLYFFFADPIAILSLWAFIAESSLKLKLKRHSRMECVNNWWLLERPPVRPYSARCHIPRNVIELTVSILIFIVIKTK